MCANKNMNNPCCNSSLPSNDCNILGPFLAVNEACIKAEPPPPVSSGTVIPFSSGITPINLSTLLSGIPGIPSLIGFGTALPGFIPINDEFDTSGFATEAFSFSRSGTITAISASFTVTIGINALVGVTTVNARIYRAPEGSTVFTATSASIDLAPTFTGIVSTGITAFGSADITPVPLVRGDRLLMVFSITTSGVTVLQTLTGTASAGITIE